MGSIMTEQQHGESLAGNRVDPVGPVGLTDALRLPCGVVLPNRIAKAAMTECLADPQTNDPNVRHERLFQRWAQGGRADGHRQRDGRPALPPAGQ
jgi:hypothetical protein